MYLWRYISFMFVINISVHVLCTKFSLVYTFLMFHKSIKYRI